MIDPGSEQGPEEQTPSIPEDDYEVPEDDTVIARAFRLSLVVIGTVAVVAGLIFFIVRQPEQIETIEDAGIDVPKTVTEAVTLEPPPVGFTDVTAEAGIAFRHVNGAYGDHLLPETMGGGVAFLDYDNDGDQDLLFVNSTYWPWVDGSKSDVAASALYQNDGSGRFTDVSEETGLSADLYGMGVSVADYDGDGFSDVFLTAVGNNRLYRNQQGKTFVDVTAMAGVAGNPDTWSSGSAFFDYDHDGDLDLFVTNYVTWSREIDFEVDYQLAGIGRAYGPPTNYAGTQSYLYRNDGDGTFTDISAASGIHVLNKATGAAVGKGLGVLPVDVNGDGWLDVVVSNDTVQNFLFVNLGDGRFEESGAILGIAFDNSGSATGAMGIDAARYNNDGDLAVAIGNFANEMTSFFVAQEGIESFTDEAIVAGIGPDSRQALSFGLFFFDYDLDGWLDVFQANGHVENEINAVQPSQRYEQPAQLFWNCGPECSRNFVRVPSAETGDLARPIVGRGAAYADVDRDGDLDIVITQVGRAPLLLRNDQQTGHHWIRVRLIGAGPNRDAIGATLGLKSASGLQTRLVMPNRSYLSQMELPITFGLGDAVVAEQLTIRWPDGSMQVLEHLSADTLHEIEQPPAAH